MGEREQLRPLTKAQRAVLLRMWNDGGVLREWHPYGASEHAMAKRLRDRGLVARVLSRARSMPLGAACFRLTDAGEEAIGGKSYSAPPPQSRTGGPGERSGREGS